MSAPALSMREQNARRFLGIAATLGVLGVATNLGGEGSLLTKLILAAGLVTLVWSIHRFGRLGPEEAISFAQPEPAESLKKKKKKRKRASGGETPQAPSESESGAD